MQQNSNLTFLRESGEFSTDDKKLACISYCVKSDVFTVNNVFFHKCCVNGQIGVCWEVRHTLTWSRQAGTALP